MVVRLRAKSNAARFSAKQLLQEREVGDQFPRRGVTTSPFSGSHPNGCESRDNTRLQSTQIVVQEVCIRAIAADNGDPARPDRHLGRRWTTASGVDQFGEFIGGR